MLMSGQQNSSLGHTGHLQDLTTLHEGHVHASPHARRRHRDSEQDFIITGARIGSVHGGRTVGGSSGRNSPFGTGSVVGDVSMSSSLEQPQRFRMPSRVGGGFHQGMLSL